MSYSSESEVAALVPRIADGSGDFTASTQPTLTQVTLWLDQVSKILDAYLRQNGFLTPVTNADALLILDFFVSQEVAAICEGVRGSGRFGPTSKAPHGSGRFSNVFKDVKNFVDEQSNALERLGADRTFTELYGVHYRENNESGDLIKPFFQREAFMNTDRDWDER